jgi:ribosomal protein L37AE/L43A
MSFDDIPEDREESYPCQCGGNVTADANNLWTCDKCEWRSDGLTEDGT